MLRLPKLFQKRAQLSIIFVIDPPNIDEWAIPLLCSLKLYAPKDADLIAYVPNWKLPLITPSVRALMDDVGARVECFDPAEGDKLFASSYPIGNKLLACKAKRPGERTLFLDTDTFLNAPLDEDALFKDADVAICPAEFNSFSNKSADWQPIYDLFDLPLPEKSLIASRSGKQMYPYFNAGVIGFTNKSRFGEVWAETAHRLDHAEMQIEKRPWLDQIALPVACARMGVSPRHLTQDWNFALNGMKTGRDLEPDMRIVHFHLVRFLKFEHSYARVSEILRAVLGSTKLHDIARTAILEKSKMIRALSNKPAMKYELELLQYAQQQSERRREQLEGY